MSGIEHECDFPDTCQVCTPRVRPTPDTVDYTFIAKFTTECYKCDGAIFDGDVAARMKPSGNIVCEGCLGNRVGFDFT